MSFAESSLLVPHCRLIVLCSPEFELCTFLHLAARSRFHHPPSSRVLFALQALGHCILCLSGSTRCPPLMQSRRPTFSFVLLLLLSWPYIDRCDFIQLPLLKRWQPNSVQSAASTESIRSSHRALARAAGRHSQPAHRSDRPTRLANATRSPPHLVRPP
jgi:hypothetical protein